MSADHGASTAESGRSPHKRRWWQFRLRTLLLFALLCALIFGQVAGIVGKPMREKRIAEELVARGAVVIWGPPITWKLPDPPGWSDVLCGRVSLDNAV
jgi:hypothetical protein